MTLEIEPVTIEIQSLPPGFGAEVRGVNLAQLDPEEFAAIHRAFLEHGVLVFRNQDLSEDDHLRFSRMFGPLQRRTNWVRERERLESEYLADISNLDGEGRILPVDAPQLRMNAADRLWHTDGTFAHVPSLISLLYAREVPPEEGNTEFADMRAAYDGLSEAQKEEYEPLVLMHDLFYSRAQVGFHEFKPEIRALKPPVQQVMVRRHEETGRRSLYLASHASHVVGRDVKESRALIEQLIAYATQPRFVRVHQWQAGDLVMWDNRCTMHRARPFDELRYRRVMQRATVIDTLNSVERAQRDGRVLQV